MQTLQVWDVELGYNHIHETGDPDNAFLGGEPMWCIFVVEPDSNAHGHLVLPHSAFEWRCAQIGIPHDDNDSLIDAILYGPYIPDPNDALGRLHPDVKKVLDETHGLPTIWTPGVSDAERLAAYKARIASVKRHRAKIVNAPREKRAAALAYVGSNRVAALDPLGPLRELQLDPVRVQSRRLAVEWYRANTQRPATPSYNLKPPATFVGMQPTGM